MLKTVNASQAQIDSALGKLRKAASQDQERTHGSDNPAASTQKTDYPAASSPQVQTHNGQPTPAHAQGPGISTQREESSAGSVNGSSSVTEQKPSALTTASGDISNTEVDDSRMQTADASEKRASDYLPAAQTRGQASKRPAQVWGRVLICIGLMLTLAAAGVGGWQFLRLRKKTLGSEERSVPDKRNGKEG